MAFGTLNGHFSIDIVTVGSTLAATGSVVVAAGDLVFVNVAEVGALQVTGITDNLSNTYTQVVAGKNGTSNSCHAFFTIVTHPGTLTTVTASGFSGSHATGIAVGCYQGPFLAIDAAPALVNDNATPYTATATGTLAQASELVFGYIGINGAGATLTHGGSFSLDVQSQSLAAVNAGIESLVVSATTTQTPTFSTTTSANSVVGSASFKQRLFGTLVGTMSADFMTSANPEHATGSVVVLAGDLVFVCTAQETNLQITGASDNLGNSYSAVNAGLLGGSAAGRGFYSIVTVPGTLTQVNVAGITTTANDSSIAIAVFAGTFSGIDKSPTMLSDSSSPYTGPATGTLSQANELVIGYIATVDTFQGDQSADQLTANGSFTLDIGSNNTGGASGSAANAVISSLLVAATTTQTAAFTGATATVTSAVGTASFAQGTAPLSSAVSEAASAADSPSVTLAATASMSEAASAADSPSAIVIEAIAEAASAADSVSSIVTIPAAISEAASATDSPSVIAVKAIAEAASAADSVTQTTAATGAISEAASAADSVNGLVTIPVARVEAASAADSVSQLTAAAGTISESGIAVDVVSETMAAAGTISESVSATDAPAGSVVAPAAIAEAGSASDSVSVLATLPGVITETLSAADTASVIAGIARAIVEAASATDATTAIVLAALVETLAASDSPSATKTILAAIAETLSAADVVTVGAFSAAVVEAADAADALTETYGPTPPTGANVPGLQGHSLPFNIP